LSDDPLEPFAVAALAALLVGASTVAARRWGHGVGGVISAFPLIVGPVLMLAAVRHGTPFAAQAAGATLLGLVSLGGFVFVYAWSATRLRSSGSLACAWLAAAALGVVVGQIEVRAPAAFACAMLAMLAARRALPPEAATAPRGGPLPRWDLQVRMGLTALLIVALIAAADRFGPIVAGALAALPALASVLAVTTHRQEGLAAVLNVLRGTVDGMSGFAAFCLVVATLVQPAGILVAFLLATSAAAAIQTITLRRHASGTSLAAAR